MRIVGIDPSLRNFGVVVADLDLATMKIEPLAMRLIETDAAPKAKSVRRNSIDLDRCRHIVNELEPYLEAAAMVFCEVPVGSQSARAMASYGCCIGILSWIKNPLIQLDPASVKLAATGDKNATKAEMIRWAFEKYPCKYWLKHNGKPTAKNEHLADAIAAIEAGLKTEQFRSAMAIINSVRAAA